MTEVEWLTEIRPTGLLQFIRAKAIERKVLLFNCACCRRVWTRLDAEDQDAVKQAEASVDNPAAIRELELRFEPERIAELKRVGLRYQDQPVSESLMKLLTTQTTIRLGLNGRGRAIGILAFNAARLPEKGKPFPADPAAQALEERRQTQLVREIFVNPFRPVDADPVWLAWNDSTIVKIAQAIYDDRTFDRMPILGDALEDAGCDNADILNHCRGKGPHVRGCWVIDLILGKEPALRA